MRAAVEALVEEGSHPEQAKWERGTGPSVSEQEAVRTNA